MITLTQVRSWDTTHLHAAATHWNAVAADWERSFDAVYSESFAPGGADWTGAGAGAAQQQTAVDRRDALRSVDTLRVTATIARNGAGEIQSAKLSALDAVASARDDGFVVAEDFSVTDPRNYPPHVAAARQVQAARHAANITGRVQALAATDQRVAGQMSQGVFAADFPLDPVTPGPQPSPAPPVTGEPIKLPPPSGPPPVTVIDANVPAPSPNPVSRPLPEMRRRRSVLGLRQGRSWRSRNHRRRGGRAVHVRRRNHSDHRGHSHARRRRIRSQPMQVSTSTILLGAAALGAIFALIIGRIRKRGGTSDSPASRRSHILSASVTLLIAAAAFVDAAISADDRYLLIGIGSVLVVTSAVVLLNLRKHATHS